MFAFDLDAILISLTLYPVSQRWVGLPVERYQAVAVLFLIFDQFIKSLAPLFLVTTSKSSIITIGARRGATFDLNSC
jgi:hypothetical protein